MNENDNELKKNWRLIQPKKNSIKENNKENGLAISFYGGRKGISQIKTHFILFLYT